MHAADLCSSTTLMTELTTGAANLMISLQVLDLCPSRIASHADLIPIPIQVCFGRCSVTGSVPVTQTGCLQFEGSLVLWLLACLLALRSPTNGRDNSQLQLHTQTDSAHAMPDNNQTNVLREALPLYGMMRQVGIAMLRSRSSCDAAAMQMVDLMSSASHSGHWCATFSSDNQSHTVCLVC